MNRTTTFWFAILGALFFIVPSILGGLLIPDYNHVQQFISESYAVDTQYGNYLRFFGYIPSGILTTIFAFSALQFFPKSSLAKIGLIGFAFFYGICTILVGVFPCDAGCNKELINPTISQLIHDVSGGFTYLFVPICMILIGISTKENVKGKRISVISIICGIVALIGSLLIFNNPSGDYIGLFQRILESSILFWLINFALFIKNHTNV